MSLAQTLAAGASAVTALIVDLQCGHIRSSTHEGAAPEALQVRARGVRRCWALTD
jgi:hypothetical protein